jgi:hypothetical protein
MATKYEKLKKTKKIKNLRDILRISLWRPSIGDRAWEIFGHDRQMGVIISEVGRRINATSELRAE